MTFWVRWQAELARLTAAGHSASEIARTISRLAGRPVSRHAVIGRWHRLGMTRRPPASAAPRLREMSAAASRPPAVRQTVQRAAALPPLADADIPPPQRRTLLQLTACTCRWPVGDPGTPGFFFCGGQTAADEPYCAAHAARARARARAR